MIPASGFAQTEPRVTIDVTASGAAESNPFFEQDADATLSATLQVDPKVYWEDETTSVVLDASMRMTQYLQNYGNDFGVRVGVLARRELSTRTSLTASAGFQSSRSRVQDFFFSNLDTPLNPVEFPDVTFTDVTIAGRRNRVETLDASLGLDHILSEDETIGFFGATSYSQFGGSNQRDFRTGTVGTRYRRQLSERTSINASVSGTIADYIGTKNGDARIISPTVGIDNKIDERISLTASVGVSLASVDDAFGNAQRKTYLTGAFSICDKGVQSALCGSISRSAEPTALGGIRGVTNLAVVFDKQLSQKERISVSARYGQTSQSATPLALPGIQNSQLYGVTGTYSKDLNERLAFVVTPSFTKFVEKGIRDEANYAISVGIRLRLGKLR